jgi:hypothetical protein
MRTRGIVGSVLSFGIALYGCASDDSGVLNTGDRSDAASDEAAADAPPTGDVSADVDDDGPSRTNTPCCSDASNVCGFEGTDGLCWACCKGDVCWYPPDPDGTCRRPVGPDR